MVCHVFDYCCGFFSPWRNKKCISNSRWVIDICIVYTEWRRNVCAKPFYTHIHTYILFDVQMVNNYFLLTWFAPNFPYVDLHEGIETAMKRFWLFPKGPFTTFKSGACLCTCVFMCVFSDARPSMYAVYNTP